MAFTTVVNGQAADASTIQQVISALSGTNNAGQPIAMTSLADSTNWALSVANKDTTSGKALIVYASDGATPLLVVDKNGARASGNGTTAAGSIVTANDTGTVKTTMLAANAATLSSVSNISTAASITATTGVIASPSITMTTLGYPCLFLFVASYTSDTANSSIFYPYLDGVQQAGNTEKDWNAGELGTYKQVVLATMMTPSAASHTFQAGWYASAGTLTLSGSVYRSLTVVEFRR